MAKKSEDTQIIIQDDCLGQYYIKVDDCQYSIFQKTESQYERMAEGYYMSLAQALKRIAKKLTIENNSGQILTIEEYIKEYELQQKLIIDKLGFLDKND